MNKKDERLNMALAMLDTMTEVASGASKMLLRIQEDAEFYAGKLKEAIEEYSRLASIWEDEDDEETTCLEKGRE